MLNFNVQKVFLISKVCPSWAKINIASSLHKDCSPWLPCQVTGYCFTLCKAWSLGLGQLSIFSSCQKRNPLFSYLYAESDNIFLSVYAGIRLTEDPACPLLGSFMAREENSAALFVPFIPAA